MHQMTFTSLLQSVPNSWITRLVPIGRSVPVCVLVTRILKDWRLIRVLMFRFVSAKSDREIESRSIRTTNFRELMMPKPGLQYISIRMTVPFLPLVKSNVWSQDMRIE